MKDSYEIFFSNGYITKEQFFDFGLNETILSPLDRATEEWNNLKDKIYNNKKVYIRGFGRNSLKSPMFLNLYSKILNNDNIAIDPTNNNAPSRIIRDLTGYSKNKTQIHNSIRNYQISHVFGKTKNVFCFTAPWNIAYIPKILDPFTGHEAKGNMINEYTSLYHKKVFSHFEPLIEDYNKIISTADFQDRLLLAVDEIKDSKQYNNKELGDFIKSINDEFKKIEQPVC